MTSSTRPRSTWPSCTANAVRTKRPNGCCGKSLTDQPELYEAAYSLGLLLVEMQNYREGAAYLEQASRGMPERARIHYNLGLLYAQLQNPVGCRKRTAGRART